MIGTWGGGGGTFAEDEACWLAGLDDGVDSGGLLGEGVVVVKEVVPHGDGLR